MGTWGLTQADLFRIDTYHRRHLRQIIGVRWPNRISNVALYHRCQSRPISESIITARWRLFGHVLRLPRDAPAQRTIDHYFADTEAATFRGRPRTSLPSTLCSDLRHIGSTLRQPTDIEALLALTRYKSIYWQPCRLDFHIHNTQYNTGIIKYIYTYINKFELV